MALEIVYYTDPLCCWSWAFEPQWRKLRYEFRDLILWRYCMGGLIPDWKHYNDAVNSISRPSQMGPLWYEARQISGMPIYDKLWSEDPPGSSFPSCVAVKCAALQSRQAEEDYLRLLREAAMLEGKNIAKREVLLDIATSLEARNSVDFDSNRFERDLLSKKGNELFKEDLKEVRYNNVHRFPALTISNNGKGVIIVGFRPYKALVEALKVVQHSIQPLVQDQDKRKEEYMALWKSATERELEELVD